jgi:hypothetical protein
MTLLRAESFVPLTTAPTGGNPGDHRVTVVSDARQFQPLKSLESPATPMAGSVANEKICEPRVTLQREGERITGIRIQCTCGQVMDLACVYPPTIQPA